MSKYIEPPESPETAALKPAVADTDKAGANFVDKVENACDSIIDSVTDAIDSMIQGVVDAATGAYDLVVDVYDSVVENIDDLFSSDDHLVKGDESFSECLDECLEDFENDMKLTENCNMQSTLFEAANEKVQTLSPKEIKTFKEDTDKLKETSAVLAEEGTNKVKQQAKETQTKTIQAEKADATSNKSSGSCRLI